MPKRPVKAQASSTRAFGSGAGTATLPFAFSSTASPLSYVWEPPDLRSINDPNVVVAFKNLSKRDSTTKAKALEELQAHISSVDNIEESVLETWISFYPRTSIEESRRVRQLSHVLQGRISLACGKRIARFMPQVVGPWLAGTYDPDRSVARAASDALRQVFPSPDKLHGIRKAYQTPLLEYCRNIIDNETPQTLTDERTSSPDEVESKYNRVLATAVSVFISLLSELPEEVVQLQQSTYIEALSDEKLWAWAYSGDPIVRRTVHRLLRTALTRHPDLTTPAVPAAGKAYIGHGLRSDQTTTSLDFVESLASLVGFNSTVWSSNAPGPKGFNRLCSFLRRGSQLGPPEYWTSVAGLVQRLSSEAVIRTLDDAQDLLVAVRAGINRKDEPRANLSTAWRAYLQIVQLVVDALTYDDMNTLLDAQVLPIVKQYMRPAEETAQWKLPEQVASSVVERLLENTATRTLLARSWAGVTTRLIEDMQISQPEQSKEFRASQDAVAKHGAHWAFVLSVLMKRTEQEDNESADLVKSLGDVFSAAMEILETRKGKPYGSAAIMDSALAETNVPAPIIATLSTFVREKLPNIFVSPSAKHFAGMLYYFYEEPWFPETWERTAQNSVNGGEESELALHDLLASQKVPRDFDLVTKSPALHSFIDRKVQRALAGESNWAFLNKFAKDAPNTVSGASIAHDIVTKLTNALDVDATTEEALKGLQSLTDTNKRLVELYLQSSESTHLMSRLLQLSESANEGIAQTALTLTSLIQRGFSQPNAVGVSHETLYKTIRSGLLDTSHTSISTHALVNLAGDFFEHQGAELPPDVLLELLPPLSDWKDSLHPFLTMSPLPSVGITGSLKGAVHLVKSTTAVPRDNILRLPRDAEGYSTALRMAQYATALLQKLPISGLPAASQEEIIRLFCLSLVLANDNLGVAGANHLWSQYNTEVETDMSEMISNMRSILRSWLTTARLNDVEGVSGPASGIAANVEIQLLEGSKDISPFAFNSAATYIAMIEGQTTESQRSFPDGIEQEAIELRQQRKTITLAALLVAKSTLFSTKLIQKWCNELVAELTTLELSTDADGAIHRLVLFNTLLSEIPEVMKSIARQRIVFFMKHIVPWIDGSTSYAIKAEVIMALFHLTPLISDLYGEHWLQLLKSITDSWLSAPSLDPGRPEEHSCLPVAYSALRLYGALTGAASTTAENPDPNDDLVDALKDSESDVATALFHLLSISQHCPDEYSQPLRVVNSLVSRYILKLDYRLYPRCERWYPHLFTPSFAVQSTVYEVLHVMIPEAQEQVSLDAALENKVAELPQELLSLILDTPTTKDLIDAQWERGIPLPLRSYLLSWLLLFDHFDKASQRVRTNYVESLKGLGTLPSLLDFTFDFLGQHRKGLVDASKFDITSFNASLSSEDPKQDCRQLLSHIYYLALQYTPGLVKNWWIDLRSRALVPMVGSWTERYVSPHIITAALRAVSQWAAEQSDAGNPNASPEGERLKIAVSGKANEIRASYDVDEQTMSILIRLPGAWPLRQAEVQGVSRVGIDEKKWQSWVRGCQGVITFSNNNLIDGLVAFRRNVTGALKGQTECAICYSIISADKQLPSKKCGTCKNLFHSGCLYRWFKTSNASTCPLCRNPFNYG